MFDDREDAGRQLGEALRAKGYERPVVLGNLSVSEGEIEFFGNKYTINRGEVNFYNPSKIEPIIDMDLETQVRAITVEDLLTFRLGFGNVMHDGAPYPIEVAEAALELKTLGPPWPPREYGPDEWLRRFATLPLMYQPGERWMYSLSTDVCGYLVEAISGKRFDKYLQETIFDPLDMKDTSFMVASRKADRFAANYERQADKTLKLIDDPERSNYLKEPTFFSGGGGLTGTTADYLRFCEMLRRGGELDGVRILGPRTIELMRLNHLAGGKDLSAMAIGAFSETAYEGVGFGLGFAMTLGQVQAGALGGGDYYWGGAASTIFWVDPKEDLVVIFMTQLMPSATFNFRGQLRNIIYSAIVE